MSDPARQFTITLRANPHVADPMRELKALLKLALRKHGLRCLLLTTEEARSDSDPLANARRDSKKAA